MSSGASWSADEYRSLTSVVNLVVSIPVPEASSIMGLRGSKASLDLEIRYEPLADEVAGIEMMVHGHKFSWSINDYIVSLEESFSRVLKEEIPLVPDA